MLAGGASEREAHDILNATVRLITGARISPVYSFLQTVCWCVGV